MFPKRVGRGQVAAGQASDACPNPLAVKAAIEAFVRWTIADEYPRRATFLEGSGLAEFTHYYRQLPRVDEPGDVDRYIRGLWRSEAGWAARWIAGRPNLVVLDAGCGFGTFSMLWAFLGARVLGVDLRPDRLEVARRRLTYYGMSTGRDLDVQFERRDLTADWPERVNLVWVYNALSHIDPLDNFLDQVKRHLRPSGVIVVGDVNGSNDDHLRRVAALRSEVHQEYVAPDGQRHAYAIERTFSPREISELFQSQGFDVIAHELYWRGLSQLPDPWGHVLLGATTPLRWLRPRAAVRQLLVAEPSQREAMCLRPTWPTAGR